MAITNLGKTSSPPDKLVARVGSDITYISFRRGSETLTLGLSKKRYYFKLHRMGDISSLVTRAIAPNERAEELFHVFRTNGFSRKARKLYQWRSVDFHFDHERRKARPKAKKAPKKVSKFAKLSASDQQRIDALQLAGTGTCFCMCDPRYFITNYHVVRNCEEVVIKTSGYMSCASIVAESEHEDLALLRANRRSSFSSLRMSPTVPELGDWAFTAGFPDPRKQGNSIKFTEGSISSLAGLSDDERLYQISVLLQPGNSGGALADARGNIVGVVASGLDAFNMLLTEGRLPQGVNYAVSHPTLLKFLKRSKLFKKSELVGTNVDIGRSGAIKQVADASALVMNFKKPQITKTFEPIQNASRKPWWKKVLDAL